MIYKEPGTFTQVPRGCLCWPLTPGTPVAPCRKRKFYIRAEAGRSWDVA